MTNGSQAIWAAAGFAAWGEAPVAGATPCMPDDSHDLPSLDLSASRLRKHADYQRVYKASRKHFSPSMSYFFCRRSQAAGDASPALDAPRVGLTAGKVLGKAVDRNRIKRRMREAVRMNLARLPLSVDVILHPRKSVIDLEFAKLSAEVARIFSTVSAQVAKSDSGKPGAPLPASRKPAARSGAQRSGARL